MMAEASMGPDAGGVDASPAQNATLPGPFIARTGTLQVCVAQATQTSC